MYVDVRLSLTTQVLYSQDSKSVYQAKQHCGAAEAHNSEVNGSKPVNAI